MPLLRRAMSDSMMPKASCRARRDNVIVVVFGGGAFEAFVRGGVVPGVLVVYILIHVP